MTRLSDKWPFVALLVTTLVVVASWKITSEANLLKPGTRVLEQRSAAVSRARRQAPSVPTQESTYAGSDGNAELVVSGADSKASWLEPSEEGSLLQFYPDGQ